MTTVSYENENVRARIHIYQLQQNIYIMYSERTINLTHRKGRKGSKPHKHTLPKKGDDNLVFFVLHSSNFFPGN